MSDRPTVLVVDDEPKFCDAIALLLEPDFAVQSAHSGQEGLDKLGALAPGLVFLDLHMPHLSGLGTLKAMRARGCDVPVVILTAYGSVDTAVRSLKLGADDYLEKPFDAERLRQTVRRLFPAVTSGEAVCQRLGIIGASPALGEAWALLERYAPTDLPLLLQGETGTGKELFALAAHELSGRSEGPFVVVDCSTLPESLLESELFGYERGAFTGADRNKLGQLEWAQGGTLFLDEIGNLPMAYQAKLLRFLQSGQYTPLGGSRSKMADVRVVCATNVELLAATGEGRFRQDLYYRIGGAVLRLPALRDRSGDMEMLALHFIRQFARKYGKAPPQLLPEALQRLVAHLWLGNVRELHHVLERAVLLANKVIDVAHLGLAPETSAIQVGAASPAGDDDIAVTIRYRCGIDRSFDLKRIKEEVALAAEHQIIEEVKKRLPLRHGELARFLHIDPKTLRSICRRCES